MHKSKAQEMVQIEAWKSKRLGVKIPPLSQAQAPLLTGYISCRAFLHIHVFGREPK